MSRTITFNNASGGWAIIGFNTLNGTMKASQVLGMYSGGNITSVSRYNTGTRTYTTYIKGVPPTDYTLTPGMGYWVFVQAIGGSANGTLSYNP